MRIYGNGQCRGCHKQVVCRDLARPGNKEACRAEHAPGCAELARDILEADAEIALEYRALYR
jgi:hypothetical protein